MGAEYALVHVIFTIPPALILTIILYPLFTRLDLYKICFLICVAVLYTIPWDAYLIHGKIWTYPSNAVIGPTLFLIPIEELFFFVIQTYITSLLYILFNKPTLFAIHLHNANTLSEEDRKRLAFRKMFGQVFFASMSTVPIYSNDANKSGTYMRLICMWAGPVLLLLWTFTYDLLLNLPQSKTRLPIAIPTLYLWIVDSIALQRGIWTIENGTKLGIQLWSGLDVEEAAFFLITNTMVVFGLVAFDKSIAVLETFSELYPSMPSVPSPRLLVEALSLSPTSYDLARIEGLRNARAILARKSRSFYLASGVFRGRLRIDLITLYAYCRIGDDLVDHAKDAKDAQRWIGHLSRFLDVSYAPKKTEEKFKAALEPFSPEARSVLSQLPVDKLPAEPLYTLLDGFRSDVSFLSPEAALSAPIRTHADLELYASRVASTVAELCLHLVYYHSPPSQRKESATSKEKCLKAGKRMGLALQYTNIARDVVSDGREGRCYIPTDWFQKPPPPTAEMFQVELQNLRRRVLDLALNLYDENKGVIEELPRYARDGIRVAVESYIEIGRTMREKMLRGDKLESAGGGKSGRASVPKLRRLWVGWRTMLGPGGS